MNKTRRATRRNVRPEMEALEERALLSAGNLDPTFGNNGVANGPGGNTLSDWVIAVQPDGKLVEANSPLMGGQQLRLLRQNPDGSPDSTFGTAGEALGPTGNFVPEAVAIQSDGKIVVAGSFLYNSYFAVPPPSQPGQVNMPLAAAVNLHHFFVARFNSDGTLDQTFGNDGVVLTSVGSDDTASALVLQPDNKIIVAGSSDGAFAVARYNSDGTLDSTFGSGGKTTIAIGNQGTASASSVVLQTDGQIVVAGSADGEFALTRLNADGSLDTAFGSQGITETTAGVEGASATQIAIEANGEIVTVGYAGVEVSPSNVWWEAVLCGYSSDGQLDPAFGQAGEVRTGFLAGNYWRVRESLQADGKIVVATDVLDGPPGLVLARYTETGLPDPTFGASGQASISFGTDMGDMALQPDGKIVVSFGSGPQLARFTNDSEPLTALAPAPAHVATGATLAVRNSPGSSKLEVIPASPASTFDFELALKNVWQTSHAVGETQTSSSSAPTPFGANLAGIVLARANSFGIIESGGPALDDNAPVMSLDNQPLLWLDPVLDDLPPSDAAEPTDEGRAAELYFESEQGDQGGY